MAIKAGREVYVTNDPLTATLSDGTEVTLAAGSEVTIANASLTVDASGTTVPVTQKTYDDTSIGEDTLETLNLILERLQAIQKQLAIVTGLNFDEHDISQ